MILKAPRGSNWSGKEERTGLTMFTDRAKVFINLETAAMATSVSGENYMSLTAVRTAVTAEKAATSFLK